MRFNFVGELKYNPIDAQKNPYLREGKTKTGHDYKTLNLSVVAAVNNRAFIELFGMERDTVSFTTDENEKVEVNWGDRNEESVVNKIPSYRKFVFNVGGVRKEFVTELDFVKYIADHIGELKDKRLQFTGRVTKNIYQGRISDRFQLQNIYDAPSDKKNVLKILGDFWFQKDSIDTGDWNKEQKVYIYGWTNEFISSDEGNKYVPLQLCFDAKRAMEVGGKGIEQTKYRLKQIHLELTSDDKIKNNLKSGKVYKIPVEISYKNGAEEIDPEEIELTSNQEEAVALGLNKREDFIPRDKVYGQRVTVYNLTYYDLKGEYADGCIVDNVTVSDFEDNIYVPATDEKLDDVLEGVNKPETESEPENDFDPDDLFS